MKKILLSLAFIAFSFSVNAQNVIERQTIKDNPDNLFNFVNEDITLLYGSYPNLNEDYKPELINIIYNKYKSLTSELHEDEIIELTDSVKEEITLLLGEDFYQVISENETLFKRITGTAYLPN